MAHGNVRTRERFEVSLGGLQIATIVVSAVLVLGVVFYLGLEAGQRIGARRAEATRPASLGDLDAVAVPSPRPQAGKDLTFPSELPRAKPPATPPPPRTPEPAPAPEDAKPAAPAAPDAAEVTPPAPAPAASPANASPARGGWTVQLGASQRREEAEALARKVKALGPRIEEADVPGKGHFFRVRVGRFESKEQADKYRSDVVRETGISGMVVPPG